MPSQSDHAGATGSSRAVELARYSELSRSSELVRRTFSPLAAAQFLQAAAQSGVTLRAQAVDLSVEHFVVYVPPTEPAGGYALLVFVPPWSGASIPAGWRSVLDREGVIYVSAAGSGNDASVIDRREPLALLAADNIRQLYHVDPHQVWIAGFSGGAHVALRLALAYPDVFGGALLNAGSDPIGGNSFSIPLKDLFEQFQTSTHVVYLTGEDDSPRLEMDRASEASLRKWCVTNVDVIVTPRVGHEVADSAAFSSAVRRLKGSRTPDTAGSATCRAAVYNKMAEQLREVESATAQGRSADAHGLLKSLDMVFGGLAAPRSVELSMQCRCLPIYP